MRRTQLLINDLHCGPAWPIPPQICMAGILLYLQARAYSQCPSDRVCTSLRGFLTAPSKEVKAVSTLPSVSSEPLPRPPILFLPTTEASFGFLCASLPGPHRHSQEPYNSSSSCTECCSAQAVGCWIVFTCIRQHWTHCDQNGVGCALSLMNKSDFCIDSKKKKRSLKPLNFFLPSFNIGY